MNVPWLEVSCVNCGAAANQRCYDAASWLQDPDHPVYLPNPHAERIEAAAFIDALAQPQQDRAPITDAEILNTDLV